MQGKKDYQEKLFAQFQLSERIPKHNFYRRLKAVLDLEFLYPITKTYYGSSGQKSIDPIVFFKLCLVGYLENIISDRHLIQHSSMRLDILYFLGYDIWRQRRNRCLFSGFQNTQFHAPPVRRRLFLTGVCTCPVRVQSQW